jgi:regulator of replication initiation timing
MSRTCDDIDALHRQIVELTTANNELRAENGRLNGQQHDLVQAKEAACADARRFSAELDALRIERDSERARANRRGW